MKNKDTCSTCLKGIAININGDVLCMEKGVVSPNYSCMGYRKPPDIKLPEKPAVCTCSDCRNFIRDNEGGAQNTACTGDIGYCRLFTVRSFDGRSKKACSRFDAFNLSLL